MWMEGIPQDNATQGLLYFQRNTIEAMYKHVQNALAARMSNSSDHGLKVSDYLNFYCLGTRETKNGSEATGESTTDDEKVLVNTRRHQIYVHSVGLWTVSFILPCHWYAYVSVHSKLC
jgi:phospholipase D1/2